MIMVCASMAELVVQYKVIWFAMQSISRESCAGIDAMLKKRGKSVAFFEKFGNAGANKDVVDDPAKPEDQVKNWMWISGLLVTIVIAMIIGELQWVNPLHILI